MTISIRQDFEQLDNAIIESVTAGNKHIPDIAQDIFDIAATYIAQKYAERPVFVKPVVAERVLHLMRSHRLYCRRGEGWEVVTRGNNE